MTASAQGIDRFVVVPAAYVFLLRDGVTGPEVLLQLRQGTGFMDGHWAAAAAGHVEKGETAVDAARREAREEIDVDDLALEGPADTVANWRQAVAFARTVLDVPPVPANWFDTDPFEAAAAASSWASSASACSARCGRSIARTSSCW